MTASRSRVFASTTASARTQSARRAAQRSSRAYIATGKGVYTLDDGFDGRQRTVQQLLRASGYRTAVVGKWHLGHGGVHDPTGFDYWNVLPGQGLYHNPEMIEMGVRSVREGYATDLITDYSLGWLESLPRGEPFCLMVHHKAPHRPWEPDAKHAALYEDRVIPEPPTFDDDYSNRAWPAAAATMRIDRDLTKTDLKQDPPPGLVGRELKQWQYQRYIKDYLRCIASVDDNVGRLLDYLDEAGLADNTLVIYTSDQGFFLGDHGWYDKRFMYEESLRMPFVARLPGAIPPGESSEAIVLNTDFAPTFLDYAGVPVPGDMQGQSARAVLGGSHAPAGWRNSMYYRYYMRDTTNHNVAPHYGIRTHRYKLIYYYDEGWGPTAWELFDLVEDPYELNSVYDDPTYGAVVTALKAELARLRAELGDESDPW